MSIIPVVSDKVKAKKPIDDPYGVCICYHRGSKLAETAIVAKIELSLHFGHIQRGVTMNKQTLRWLIPIILAVSDKVKAGKPIDGPLEVSICCHGG